LLIITKYQSIGISPLALFLLLCFLSFLKELRILGYWFSLFTHQKEIKKCISFTLLSLIHIYAPFFLVLKYSLDFCVFLSFSPINHELQIVALKSLFFRCFSVPICQNRCFPSLSHKKRKETEFLVTTINKTLRLYCVVLSSLFLEIFFFETRTKNGYLLVS
jgi:hypothetical protein